MRFGGEKNTITGHNKFSRTAEGISWRVLRKMRRERWRKCGTLKCGTAGHFTPDVFPDAAVLSGTYKTIRFPERNIARDDGPCRRRAGRANNFERFQFQFNLAKPISPILTVSLYFADRPTADRNYPILLTARRRGPHYGFRRARLILIREVRALDNDHPRISLSTACDEFSTSRRSREHVKEHNPRIVQIIDAFI